MIKNKLFIDKTSKIILFIFILYLIVMLCIFLPIYIKNRREKLYIVSDEFKIKYEKGKWSNIDNKSDYNLQTFHFYENGSYIGDYQALYTNKFYLYNSGKKLNYTGNLFGYRGTIEFSVLDANIVDSIKDNDKKIITKVLEENDLPIDLKLNLYQKINFDLDNDGQIDYIYCISNFYMDNNSGKYYSIIFSYIDGSINVIDKVITDLNGTYEKPMLRLSHLIDIRNDNKYEVLYMNNYFSQTGVDCVKLYNLNKNEMVKDFCE